MSKPAHDGEPLRHRALLFSAVVSIALGLLASGWQFLASQSPSSPLHVGPLAGPIGRLASFSWLAGIAGLALWAALGPLALPESRSRRLVRLLLAGWWVLLAGHLLGALLGTHGVQVIGAYPRVTAVLVFKLAGFAALAVFVADFLLACLGRMRR